MATVGARKVQHMRSLRHAFGWPLELLVALGRSGAALAAGRPRTEAPAQERQGCWAVGTLPLEKIEEPRASPRPVGTRTKRRLPPTEVGMEFG